MRRRTFIKALIGMPTLPLLRPQPQQPSAGYTDSNNRTPAQLAALHDGNTKAGGVEYQG